MIEQINNEDVALFEGYVDGEPLVKWLDRSKMPQPGDRLCVAAGTLENIGRVMGTADGQSTAGAATDEEIRAELYRAAISCGHSIDSETVTLYRSPSKDGNALNQLAGRLKDAFDRLAAPAVQAQPLAAEVQAPSDSAMLDFLDKWIAENRVEGWKEFHFAFDTNGTAREQIAEQMEVEAQDAAAQSAEGGAS